MLYEMAGLLYERFFLSEVLPQLLKAVLDVLVIIYEVVAFRHRF